MKKDVFIVIPVNGWNITPEVLTNITRNRFSSQEEAEKEARKRALEFACSFHVCKVVITADLKVELG